VLIKLPILSWVVVWRVENRPLEELIIHVELLTATWPAPLVLPVITREASAQHDTSRSPPQTPAGVTAARFGAVHLFGRDRRFAG
jgi:hypothetical protein